MKTIRVGTRNSPLAMRQTMIVIEQLQEIHGDFAFEIVPIVTKGDRLLSVSLSKIGGKGLFIKEVEQALVTNQIDFAVHSLKDMPAKLASGVTLAAIPKRSNPADCLIFQEVTSLEALPVGACIGTSSLRRAVQLKNLRQDLHIESIRGNIGTRLQRMEEQKLDGIVLAAAGLERLGWLKAPTHPYTFLTTSEFVPAVGQGALAVECRSDDSKMVTFLNGIDDSQTRKAVTEERAFLALLDGNCDLPIGAYLQLNDTNYQMYGFLGDKQSRQFCHTTIIENQPEGMGEQIGHLLLKQLKDKQK